MSLHATFIEHTFVSILALYVTLECAVTILQTRAAEKSCGRVPEGFEKKLTLAGIRKAADYTGELAQANLLLTVVGAGFASTSSRPSSRRSWVRAFPPTGSSSA